MKLFELQFIDDKNIQVDETAGINSPQNSLGTSTFGQINADRIVTGSLIVGTNVGQGTAGQIFIAQPTTPYYVGDMWSGGTAGDLKFFTTARATGVYTAGDWILASKYTDDTVVTTLVGNLGSVAYYDKVKTAMEDETIIVGGYIKTSLIEAGTIIAGSVAAENITGTTITGKVIRTAATNKRIEMNSTGNLNELAFYNDDNTLSGKFYGAGSEIQGGPWLFLTAKTYIDGNVLMTGALSLHGSGDKTIFLRAAVATPTWIMGLDASPYEIQVNRTILPHSTTPCDLGDSTYNWRDIYLSRNIIVGGTVDGVDIASHASNASAHHSSVSNNLAITPASYIGGAITCNSGSIDQTDANGRTRQYICGLKARTEPGNPASGEVYLYFNSSNNNLCLLYTSPSP